MEQSLPTDVILPPLSRPFEQSAEINELAAALSAAQGEIQDPEHDAKVDYVDNKGRRVNYTYSSLTATLKAIRPVFAKHGLSVTQHVVNCPETGKIIVVTQVMHKSGQWQRSRFGLNHADGKPQEQAGVITYNRRYTLAPAAGISSETDTDGSNDSVATPPPQANRGAPQQGRQNQQQQRPAQGSKPPPTPPPQQNQQRPATPAEIARAMEASFAAYGRRIGRSIDRKMLEAVAGGRLETLTEDQVEQLRGLKRDLESGGVTFDEVFGRSAADALNDAFA